MADHNTQSDDTFQNELIEAKENESTSAVMERGSSNARCPVCHQVTGAAAGDAEPDSIPDVAISGNITDDAVSGNVTDDAVSGNVTDDAVSGNVIDDAEPLIGTEPGSAADAEPGCVTDDAEPGWVTDDTELGSVTDDALSGNVTDYAISGNVTDDAEPLIGAEPGSAADAGPGCIADVEPGCVTDDTDLGSITDDAEPAADRCPHCHQVLPATAVAAEADAETGATEGDAERTIVQRTSVVYYNNRADTRYRVTVAGPGERYGRIPNSLIFVAGGPRTLPQDPLPPRSRTGPFHSVVSSEEAINQEDDRRTERRQRSLERRSDPDTRRTWIQTFYDGMRTLRGSRTFQAVCCVSCTFIILAVIVICLSIVFLGNNTGASVNNTGSSANETGSTSSGIYLRGGPRTDG